MAEKTHRRASVSYLTKEGIRNVWSNRLMSIASVAVLTSCLVLIGIAVMLFVNVDAMLENVEDQNVIMVYLNDGLSDDKINKVGADIRMLPNIGSADFVSKDDAYQAQLDSMGADANLLDGLKDNPMPDSYKVTLDDLIDYDNVLKMLETIDNVDSVRGNSDLAGKIRDVRTGVTYISLGIIIMLLAVSLFIIANTVRVTMYNRRLEISIMKAVGATNWFIRWPFIIEGVVIGIIAGFVSLALVFGLYELAMGQFGTIFTLFGTKEISFLPYALPMLAAFIVVGVSAGVFGSIFSMTRYLKEQGGVVSNDNEHHHE